MPVGNKSDMSSGAGPTFSGRTPGGSRGIPSIPPGVGAQAESGPSSKAGRESGWPGVADSSLGPNDRTQSAK